jgi:hypothetical protein
MQTVATIGFDIAKSVFQVHGVDAAGQAALQSSISSISGTRRCGCLLRECESRWEDHS